MVSMFPAGAAARAGVRVLLRVVLVVVGVTFFVGVDLVVVTAALGAAV